MSTDWEESGVELIPLPLSVGVYCRAIILFECTSVCLFVAMNASQQMNNRFL